MDFFFIYFIPTNVSYFGENPKRRNLSLATYAQYKVVIKHDRCTHFKNMYDSIEDILFLKLSPSRIPFKTSIPNRNILRVIKTRILT